MQLSGYRQLQSLFVLYKTQLTILKERSGQLPIATRKKLHLRLIRLEDLVDEVIRYTQQHCDYADDIDSLCVRFNALIEYCKQQFQYIRSLMNRKTILANELLIT